MSRFDMSPGGIATLACLLEVSAPKPGNVHRAADFEDVTFTDFAISAVVLGEVIEACSDATLGQTILSAVQRTQAAVATNTNLGLILMIVPLAKVATENCGQPISVDLVKRYLAALAETDGQQVFEAIRIAKPGGLGEAERYDVMQQDNPVNLVDAMEQSAHKDDIALQYTNGFDDVLGRNLDLILQGRTLLGDLTAAIVFAHIALMSRQPDSLIARKCGLDTARHGQMLATKALECVGQSAAATELGDDERAAFWAAAGELDFWLRSDGHRRNPGTTADLIAASLFAGIFNDSIQAPYR